MSYVKAEWKTQVPQEKHCHPASRAEVWGAGHQRFKKSFEVIINGTSPPKQKKNSFCFGGEGWKREQEEGATEPIKR